jgi:hypothetical protein
MKQVIVVTGAASGFGALTARAVDRCGPFRRFSNEKERGQMQSQNHLQFAAHCALPSVGPELLNKFEVDKTS